MKIDRISAAAWQRHRAVRLAALADAPESFGTTHAEALAWEAEHWQAVTETLPTFIAVLDGEDIAMVRSTFTPGSQDAELISLWVAPNTRGRGVATALIGAVVEWARSKSFARLLLDVEDDNASAITLYERLGFKRTGVTSTFPAPREHITEHQRALNL